MRFLVVIASMFICSVACESDPENSSQLTLTDLNTGDQVIIEHDDDEVFAVNLQSGAIMALPNNISLPASDLEFTDALTLTGVSLDDVFEADYTVLGGDLYDEANSSTDVTARAKITCYGSDCDGVDPKKSGCSDDADTLDHETTGVWPFSLRVDQRYSNTCGTRWSRFTAPIHYVSTATIHRDYPSKKKSWTHNGQLNYSDMLYCPQDKCWAKASISVPGNSIETSWVKYW